MKFMNKLFVLICTMVFLSVANIANAADFTANTKQPVVTEALNRLEAMDNRKVLNVIRIIQ